MSDKIDITKLRDEARDEAVNVTVDEKPELVSRETNYNACREFKSCRLAGKNATQSELKLNAGLPSASRRQIWPRWAAISSTSLAPP